MTQKGSNKAIKKLAEQLAKEIKYDYANTTDQDTLEEATDRYVLDSVEKLKKNVLKNLRRK